MELIELDEVLMLLNTHRWTPFNEMSAVVMRALPVEIRRHEPYATSLVYAHVLQLVHRSSVVEDRDTMRFKLTQRGLREKLKLSAGNEFKLESRAL